MESINIYPVGKDGSVELPDWFRQKYNIQPGDEVSFLETEAGLLIAPRAELMTRLLNRIGQDLQARNITLEQLMGDGRQIHGDLLKEDYGIEAGDDD